MVLEDRENRVVYVPFSWSAALKIKGKWSEPVQIKIEDGTLVCRRLGQPIKGVYIAEGDVR